MKPTSQTYYTPYQLKLPLELSTVIETTDAVYTFCEVIDHIDLGFQAALAGEWNINNLCGWAGDLQTLCIDVLEFTNNSNVYSVIYNATYSIIGDEAYRLSMMDLLADTDAYNVYQLLNSSSSNLIDAFTTYYDDYVGTRYTQFTNGWGKQRIYNCVRNYTTNIFFLWIDWPLLEGYNITDTQADAIAWAFTDFIWEKIQNE